MKISKEKFESDFKLFLRFLKDNGYYTFVISYLFFGGRTKEDLFKAYNSAYFFSIIGDFGCILSVISTIGHAYKIYGHEYWAKHIAPISIEWEKFYRKHFKDI